MSATISLKRLEKGVEITVEATWDGEKWTCADDFLEQFLNAYTTGWQLSQYYPDHISGLAQEIVEELAPPLKAEFLRADPLDYSGIPEDAVF